jgi:protein-S-isoprenylcysteine O-methyltransferase Ste14
MAGTLHYWQGWAYWTILLIPMLISVSHFLRTDPELLERRMKYHEKEPEQKTIIRIGAIAFIVGFLAIAIDLRLHGLNRVPLSLVLVADAGVFIGYCLILWVFNENSYASRTIEVAEGQRVIATGPYAIIRHSMYLGTLIMYLFTPIALGSWWGVPVFTLYIPIIIYRILNEEKVLLRDLPGYYEYTQQRRYPVRRIAILLPINGWSFSSSSGGRIRTMSLIITFSASFSIQTLFNGPRASSQLCK